MFLLRFSLCSRRCLKRWRTQNVSINYGIHSPQNDWNQNTFFVIHLPSINYVIMILKTLEGKGTFISEYSSRWKRSTTVCRLGLSFEILRNNIYERIDRIDNELSKIHETEVHVFSDALLCLGNIRWYRKGLSPRKDGKDISSTTKTS